MQASEFEKHIQNAMESFSLSPSDNVWEKVAEQIAKKRKKRRFILWFLIIIVLLGASFLWMAESRKQQRKESANNYIERKDSKTNNATFNQIAKTKLVANDTNIITNRTFKIIGLPKYDADTYLHNVKQTKISSSTQMKLSKKLPANENEKSGPFKIEHNDSIDKISKQRLAQKLKAEYAMFDPNQPVKELKVEDSVLAVNQLTAQVKPDSILFPKTNPPKKINKVKWDMGFNVCVGLSNNLASVNQAGNNENNSYDVSLSNSPGMEAGSKRLNFINSGSLGLGVFMQKQLTEKFKLAIGLTYHFYQAKSKVGDKKDTRFSFYDSLLLQSVSVNSFYNQGSLIAFSNKYHLLEIPISFSYKINSNNKHPIMISAGVSPGLLIASNALFENKYKRIYYEDKAQFNRLNLSVNTGVLYALKKGKHFKIEIGPMLQYQLNNLTKPNATTQQHLIFTGIKTNFILN